ncbi:MAG TPA: Stp1/IreP family PP2C-type Ser/Thr phosphatase [Thermoleophilaceae bacterium]|jgi:protein phosphatase
MALRIVEKASVTDVGRQRQSNEDAYFERPPLFAVADGMGGARAGEVASRMAVEALAELTDAGSAAEERLREVARAANRRIYETAQGDTEHAGMGTTLTAAMVVGREVAVGHVGDSRLYRLRDGRLERLTDDHSLVEELVRQGKLTPEEAETHPQRSIITRALGPEPDVDVETFTHTARSGDVYLLCSDGLSGMVPEPEMERIAAAGGSLADAASALVDAANRAGGKDNITVVLFRVADDAGDDEDPDTLGGAATEAGIDAGEVREAASRRAAPADQPRRRPVRVIPPSGARGGAPARRRRLRLAPVVGVLLLAALAAGLYLGSRQIYFIGADDRGVVALFRGLPYELPLGIDLYTEEYATSVPATAIEDRRQRTRLLDHELRSRDDAEDRLRELERTETPR